MIDDVAAQTDQEAAAQTFVDSGDRTIRSQGVRRGSQVETGLTEPGVDQVAQLRGVTEQVDVAEGDERCGDRRVDQI